MQGAALEELVGQFRGVSDLIARMSLVYPKQVLETLVYTRALSSDHLGKRKEVDAWCSDLQESLNHVATGTHSYNVFVEEDKECNIFVPIVEITAHGVPHKHSFGRDLFGSSEYTKIVELGAKLQGLLEQGAYVQRGERSLDVSSFAQALDWLMIEARRGINTSVIRGWER